MDGLELEGTYISAGSMDYDPTWISFSADGTFREQGVVTMVCLYFLERGLRAPTGGVGTYVLDDHTLTLRYSDGLTARITFYVLPDDDLRQPRKVVLNTYLLELQR